MNIVVPKENNNNFLVYFGDPPVSYTISRINSYMVNYSSKCVDYSIDVDENDSVDKSSLFDKHLIPENETSTNYTYRPVAGFYILNDSLEVDSSSDNLNNIDKKDKKQYIKGIFLEGQVIKSKLISTLGNNIISVTIRIPFRECTYESFVKYCSKNIENMNNIFQRQVSLDIE